MHFLHKLSVVALLLLSVTATLFGQGLFSGGDGSMSNPYQIATEADLRTLAEEVNTKHNNFLGKYLKQTADISFTSGKPIEPIGGPIQTGFDRPIEQCFLGEYDGGSHKIYNLNIYDDYQLIAEGDEAHMGVGLFGVLGPQATIKNVFIASGHIYGFSAVGAIAGRISEGCTITRCKIGPDVRVSSWGNAGGIAGTSVGQNIQITECANYANISVYGMGLHKTAGGIIASSASVAISGCANFGDIWAKGGFAGGIIGYMPPSTPAFTFTYPEIKSCLNAGDISSMDPASGGIIGTLACNLSISHPIVSNSYSYGQSMATFSRTYGPICAYQPGANNPITVSKTYYDEDRYIMKKKEGPDAEIAFALGEAKSHTEVISPDFIATLNDGGASPFEADKHNINGTMPILKWINDTYDPEIDKPNQYRKDIKSTLYKKRAGSFFDPNRSGDFLIYDMSMQIPNIQAKSLGCTLDRAWSDRILAIKGGESYTFFMSTSAFRRELKEDGMYVKERSTKPADHWIITPAFRVNGSTPWFHWVGASEDGDLPSSYDLYIVADAEATTPDKFLATKPIYTVDKEDPIQNLTETINDEERTYYALKAHKVDLSQYAGKEVRLAFRDRSIDQYNLLIGQFKMAQANGIATIAKVSDCTISVVDNTLTATCPDSQLTLYSIEGQQVAQMYDHLVYRGSSSTYILVVSDPSGYSETHKVVL